ncbi:MAG: peptidylprolyl isomerase [Candidatus Marinimicrobia bacterium]|nr:peptidylprolyl isomerase [Candidatus Neomarinimicrobiota bacterium]
MKTRFTLPLIALAILVFLFACSTMDSDTLATLDGESISMDDFTSHNPAVRFADKDHDYIDSKVDEFVKKALFTRVALERGLDNDPDIQSKKMKAERRQMLQYVYDRAILGAVINDDLLREIYDRSGTELKARHILVQYKGGPRSSSDRSKSEALAIMGQINNRLSKGELFEDLAKEFTEDPSGKDSGGDLGWFGWGKMVGPFQDAAFALAPGEVSNVVETTFGYHIIKLEAKREIERGSFEEEKSALKNQARKDKGQELSQRANAFLEKQKAGAGFELITENIHTFFLIFEKSTFKQAPMDEVFKKLNFSDPLFELNGKAVGGDWIIEELKAMDDGQKPRFKSENQLMTIFDQLVTQKLILDFGYGEKYEQESAFSDKINKLVERYAYDAFIASEINEALEPSDDELMAFYETNKAKKYMEKKKVVVREIFVKDSLLAVDLKKRLDAGELIDLLAGRYTERKATKDKRGQLPPFQEGRYGLMGKEAFSLEIGDIAGPVKLGNGYSIIKLEKVIPEGAKPYSKVKGRVRTEIVGELRNKRTEAVYADLKKDHSVKINHAAVRAFYDAANN